MSLKATYLARDFDDGVIASAVLAMGNVRADLQAPEVEPRVKALIVEAKDFIGAKPNDWSVETLARVRSVLSGEVERRLFQGFDPETIGLRLGAAGGLPLGSYKLSVRENFRSVFKGETVKFAEQIVKRADLYEHLLQEDDDPKGRQWSVFARHVRNKSKTHDYWALVTAFRTEDRLQITNLWRVFPEVIPDVPSQGALDILRVFATNYAEPFSIEGVELNGFVEEARIALPFYIEQDGQYKLRIETKPHTQADILMRGSGLELRVRLGYTIDMKRYNADRARHE